jgi:hypothetical protein
MRIEGEEQIHEMPPFILLRPMGVQCSVLSSAQLREIFGSLAKIVFGMLANGSIIQKRERRESCSIWIAGSDPVKILGVNGSDEQNCNHDNSRFSTGE